MRLFAALSLVTAVLALAGCDVGQGTKSKHYTDDAIRACLPGSVAYVDVENGRYACRP